jgi:DNA-binding GntR family transcriptional regulator
MNNFILSLLLRNAIVYKDIEESLILKRRMSVQVSSAYELIRNRILSYEMAPGSVISELKLAQDFAMSRAPIREAILLLIMDGLVQNSAKKLIVAPLKLEDIIDILHIRIALESEAIRIIAQGGWLTKNQEEKLEKIHLKFSRAADQATISEHYRYDDMFHAELTSYSHSVRIIEILGQMRLQMQRARWLNLVVQSRQSVSTQEHANLLEAIKAKDCDQAVACIQLHLSNSAEAFRKALTDKQVKQIANIISHFFTQK